MTLRNISLVILLFTKGLCFILDANDDSAVAHSKREVLATGADDGQLREEIP